MDDSTIPLIDEQTQNIKTLAESSLLDEAYAWLHGQRKHHSHNNSIWHLRFSWQEIKPALQEALLKGTYRFSPLQSYKINEEYISSWDACDAIVLKALALIIQPLFTKVDYPHCSHLKGGGGIHEAIRRVSQEIEHHGHIQKSDVYHYYESIDHGVLLNLLGERIQCNILLNLVRQYCERVEIRDGHYYHFSKGIPKGCPLSPLIATLYLKPLDDALSRYGCYVRFMDDWVVLVKTKRMLRKVIKIAHKVLSALKLTMHPDKTYLGCIKKGFDFLGIHFGEAPEISEVSKENHRTRLAPRYARNESTASIGHYRERWTSWCASVLRCCKNKKDNSNAKQIDGSRYLTNLIYSKENHHEAYKINLICR